MSDERERAKTVCSAASTRRRNGSPAQQRLRRLRHDISPALCRSLGGLALWELVSRFVVANALFLAAPSQIVVAIYNLATTGELWHHIGVSAAEFALGYVIASVLGIALGLAMASSATMKQALQPWVSGLYATPTIALAPLFILWFGIGIWSKVIVVIFAGAVPGHDQHRGGTAHDQRAADRDAAQLRRDASGRSSSRSRCPRRCRSSLPA